jgi:hypothetical protein
MLALPAAAQKTSLTVYTALETDQLKAYQDGFNKINPDIELKWVRDSTGVITAKLLAEKANPQADVVMGVAASSLALLDKNGMLEPYRPLNHDAIMSQYRDKKNPPAWFGMDVWGATVCFNTVEAQKKNIPKPETWKDLLKPVYKGQIVMPNPASRQCQQGQGRADRPGVPEGRPGLGPGGLRDPQGHEEAGRGEEAGRLGVQQGRDAAVRQELRDHRAAGCGRAAGQRAQGLRGAAGEDGLHGGGREPGARAGGMDEALQREIREAIT